MSKLLFGAIFLTLAGVTVAIAGPSAAPEIDPSSAISAVTLLLGGLVVVRGRKAKK